MYSLNQDYLKLSDFLHNSRKEDVIYPGLKPFNPTVPLNTEDSQDQDEIGVCTNLLQDMCVREIMIVQLVPVVPLNEENILTVMPHDRKITSKVQTSKQVEEWKSNVVCPEFVNEVKKEYRPNPDHVQIQSVHKGNRDARGRKQQGCGFCRRNGERSSFFLSHSLKDAFNNVTCPILRSYTCPQCHATGDNAHTVAYCPLGWNAGPITSIKSTRKSCGCRWSDRHCHCV